jgi:hypothetical protein
MNKIKLTVANVNRIIDLIEEHGLADDDHFTLVEHSQSGIGSILEVEVVTAPKTKLVVEISGVENWWWACMRRQG